MSLALRVGAEFKLQSHAGCACGDALAFVTALWGNGENTLRAFSARLEGGLDDFGRC